VHADEITGVIGLVPAKVMEDIQTRLAKTRPS